MKRGRNQRRRQGVNVNRALDSNGPDVRIRGTANQIYDKYQSLARDASSSGDRVKAESYLQHAEHYFRLIKSMQAQNNTAQGNAQNAGHNSNQETANGQDQTVDQSTEDQPEIAAEANGLDENAEASQVEESKERPRARRGRRPRQSDDREAAEKPTRKKAVADKEETSEGADEEGAAKPARRPRRKKTEAVEAV